MWVFHAIWIHVLLLGSIFVIYFRSPILTNLEPQSVIKLDPPANRLVLIVTDGLRAESFFRNNCSDIPHILELMLQHNGQVGISHTRVPTESRPGHIALIAGLYEDPSAVTKGWKENPIDFDTVFHRSGKTFAWGANDVLHIFSRLNGTGQNLLFDAYDHDLDFSGREKTYELDEWVFKRVHKFLQRKGEELQREKQIVFFLHLLGLDTAGHVHKPGSELFLENLHHTELGIWNVYKKFENVFTDGKTTYLLTSDHGMTNSGSHGAGDPYETDTPFFIWGAGIDRNGRSSVKSFQAGPNQSLPLYELEQAQLTPIMSSLLGLPPPSNNFGTLPQGFLNVSAEYEAHATHANALQLIEQFKKLLLEHQRGLFSKYLNSYKNLDLNGIAAYMSNIEMHFENQNYQEAIDASQTIMKKSIAGVNYYFNYYQNSLLLSTTATFLGWIFYLLQILRTPSWQINEKKTLHKFCTKSVCQLIILNKLLLLFFILQRVPFVIAFYHVLPVNVWGLTYIEKGSGYSSKKIPLRKLDLLPIVICTELLVVTFFRPQTIALLFLVFTCFNMRRENIKDNKFLYRLIMVLIIIMTPLIAPTVGNNNFSLLVVGLAITFLRPFVIKSRLNQYNVVYAIIAIANTLLCIYQNTNHIGISLLSQIVSWSYLLYTFTSIFLAPKQMLKHRVELIFFQLTTLYALFCTTYELFFVVVLGSELMLSLFPCDIEISSGVIALDSIYKLKSVVRLAFAIILYTFYSFFGTGNIASVSSFDPIIIRCFLTTFSPFVITMLVIFKLLIPVIIVISIIMGLSPVAHYYQKQIFICLLLICDIMGLNFLFLVKNEGSWLEIGTSISHFVIMEVTTLALLLLTVFAKRLLGNSSLSRLDLKTKAVL